MTSAGHSEAAGREQLLRSVAARVDLATSRGDGGSVHDEQAWREGEELEAYLATPDGVDEEVAYVLGLLFLARVAMPQDPARGAPHETAATRAVALMAAGVQPGRLLVWILLAPFYFCQPGTQDILHPGVRDFLREMYDGPRLLSEEARREGGTEALANLGYLLLCYRMTTGNAAIARSAVAILRLAAARVAADHPDRPTVLWNLGYALLTSDQGPDEIGEAVGMLREAFRLTPKGHPNYARCANGLGRALFTEGERIRDRDELAEAAGMLRIAARSVTQEDGNLPQLLSDLGLALIAWVGTADAARARDDTVTRAAQDAVATLRRAADLAPPGDPVRELTLARLARAEQLQRDLEHLCDTTSRVDELLAVVVRRLTVPEPAPGSLLHLALLVSRQQLELARLAVTAGQGASREAAVKMAEEIGRDLQGVIPQVMEGVAAAGISAEGFTAFAKTWVSPFDMVVLLDEAVPEYRGLIEELPQGCAELADAKASLGIVLFYRAGLTSDDDSYTEAVSLTRELIADAWPPSPVLLSTWAQQESARLQLAVLAWENPALGMPADDKQGRSASLVTRLATSRAAAALAAGNAPAALEALEEGRAYLLSAALNTRRELETLRGADAELYSRIVAIDEEFLSWQRAAVAQRMGRTPAPEEMAWFRARSAEGVRLVEELRGRPGFDRFLMPRPLAADDLRPAADSGPVVSVNVDARRCDALILTPDGVRAIPLPRLSAADLADQASAFGTAVEVLGAGGGLAGAARQIFAGVLGWLWDVLAEPVLEALGYTGAPGPAEPWPRLWWSPTGLLNAFPLHAAGHHDIPGAAVIDRVASSYTPTLRALLASRARAERTGADRRVLTVAMPHTPGHAPLAETVGEATAAAGKDGLRLTGPGAAVGAVLAALPGVAIVHFACHARSDPDDPTASRLLLHDGDLLLNDLTRLRLDRAELAYLSACGTTRGGAALAGEAIHLASAFQLAGYAQSVATGWEIADVVAARAAARFHQLLAPALRDPGPLPAAQALHVTLRELRDAYRDDPWTWSALLHAGA